MILSCKKIILKSDLDKYFKSFNLFIFSKYFFFFLIFFFNGCSMYNRDFNCPMTEKGRCQSLHQTYHDLQKSLGEEKTFHLKQLTNEQIVEQKEQT